MYYVNRDSQLHQQLQYILIHWNSSIYNIETSAVPKDCVDAQNAASISSAKLILVTQLRQVWTKGITTVGWQDEQVPSFDKHTLNSLSTSLMLM